MKSSHFLSLIVMSALWAASYSAFKVLSPWLDAGGVTTVRFGMASLALLFAWPWLPGLAPRGRDLNKAIIMGIIVFVLAPRLQVAGVQKGYATHGSVLVAFEPLVASVAAAIFLGERIDPRRWLGFGLGIIGVILMANVRHAGFRDSLLTADGLILLSFICESAYSIMGKPIIQHADPFKVLTIACCAATVINLLLNGASVARAMPLLPLRAWLVLLYLSLLCTLLGYSLWFLVIRDAPVSAAALTVFTQPVFGIAIAMICLRESVHLPEIVGSTVIMLGVILGLSPLKPLLISLKPPIKGIESNTGCKPLV